MLLTFLEAKNILRHRDRLPNKDLKLRDVTLFSIRDPFPFEIVTNALGFGPELSNSADFLCPGLALEPPEDLEEEEAVKRGRLRGVVQKEERFDELEEHLIVAVVYDDEFHDHPQGDWAAMAGTED